MTISERPRRFGPQLLAAMLWLAVAAAGPACAQTIKVATLAPEGSGWMTQMRAAAKASEERTEGRVTFKFYPGGVMGNDAIVLRKIRLGQLQGSAFTGSEASTIYPSAQLYSLPFLFRERGEVDAVRAAFDDKLRAGFEAKGFQVLSISGVGFALMMSKSDIAQRAALQQRKMWVPNNDLIAERTFRGGGITPIPLPLADVFTALQTGLIDTVANTPAGAVALQWHGSLRQVLDLPLSYVIGYVLVDRRSWSKLSPADQAAVLAAFASSSELIDRGNRESDQQALEAMLSMGTKLVKPDAQEVTAWEGVGRDIVDTLVAEDRLDASLVSGVRSLLAERRTRSDH